jgi:histidine phosphotransfer protein HptB
MPWHAPADLPPDFDPGRLRMLNEEIGAEAADELIQVFLADAGARLASMRRLLAEGERAPLARAAHSIKSSAGTFGFERCAGLAREIEALAAAAPERQLRALIEAATTALDSGGRAWRATS